MRVVLAQLNYRVGDFAANTQRILQVLAEHGRQADLIVFSELSVSGYYPADGMSHPEFMRQQAQALSRIEAATRTIDAAVVVGCVECNKAAGAPFFNAINIFQAGKKVFTCHKKLIPYYGVFDEARHFASGRLPQVWQCGNQRLGFLICEDAWHHVASRYTEPDPVCELIAARVDAVIAINASPSCVGKFEQRLAVMRRIAERTEAPVVSVNQVGGNDALVFDGGSFVLDRTGQCCAAGLRFAADIQCVDLTALQPVDVPTLDPIPLYYQQLILGLTDYVEKCGFERVVIGCSGGIDSALTLALAVRALASDRVIAVTLPSPYSSPGSIKDSQLLCDNLGVRLFTLPIAAAFSENMAAFEHCFGEPPSALCQENMQARIRGLQLMAYANHSGSLLLATGNKSELSVGYATLYGDMNGALSVLGDLYKTDVYALARYYNQQHPMAEIPEAILQKPPSAELAPGQKDSDALPPYDVLDALLRLYLEGDCLSQAEHAAYQQAIRSLSEDTIQALLRRVNQAEFKRQQAALILRVQRRSFGRGRVLPIAAQSVTCL